MKVVRNNNKYDDGVVSQATIIITETEGYIRCAAFGEGNALKIVKALDSIFDGLCIPERKESDEV